MVRELNCTSGRSYQCGEACIPSWKRCITEINNINDKTLEGFRKIINKLDLIKDINEDLKKALEIEKEIKKTGTSEKRKQQLEEENPNYKKIIKDFYMDEIRKFLYNEEIGNYESIESYLKEKLPDAPYNSLPQEALFLLAELHAERRLEKLRKGAIGDEIDEYESIMANNLEFISRNTGIDDIGIILKNFSGNNRYKDKSEIDNIGNKFYDKIQQVASFNEDHLLSSEIRKLALNTGSGQVYSNQVIAKASYLIRNAFSELADEEKKIIRKLFQGSTLNKKEEDILYSLFEENSNALGNSEFKDGHALLRISLLNKYSENLLKDFNGEIPENALSLDDDNIQQFLKYKNLKRFIDSPFYQSLGTKNNDRLYLGGVGGANKLFGSNAPFGDKNKLSNVIIGESFKKILDLYNTPFVKDEKQLLPGFVNPGANKLSDTYSPSKKEDSIVLQTKKKFLNRLKNITISQRQSNTDNNEYPEIINELQKKLPSDKSFNALYVDSNPESENSFLGILKYISNNDLNDEGDDLLNTELIKNQAQKLLDKLNKNDFSSEEELQEFFQKEVMQFMKNFGFEETDAAEYLPVFYASYKGKDGAVLDLYDGNPFPFADAIIRDSDDTIKLVSIKYGKSGGVPADANALTNLINPNYTILIGSPGGKVSDINKKKKGSKNGYKEEWDKLKIENSPIEYSTESPGIKIKENVTREDLINHLSELSGHFNFNELKRIAEIPEGKKGYDPYIKDFYNKVNLFVDLLASDDKESQEALAALLCVYNIDGMQKKYNAEAINVTASTNKDAINILKQRIGGNITDEEILQMNPKDLKNKYGFDISNANGKIRVNRYYENYNLQMGLSHVVMAMWEQDIFNNFFESNKDLIPIENHPDKNLDLQSHNEDIQEVINDDKIKSLQNKIQSNKKLLEILQTIFPNINFNNIEDSSTFFKLIFSNRTDAGAKSRPGSGGTQYKYGGEFNLLLFLLEKYELN